MSTLHRPAAEQLDHAYRQMAKVARYRPAAPSDGCGNITAPRAELNLGRECEDYAHRWWAEEDSHEFWIGCCDGRTRPATVYAIEAARNLCGASPDVARRLLQLALVSLEGIHDLG
jgi:hypothetical protein